MFNKKKKAIVPDKVLKDLLNDSNLDRTLVNHINKSRKISKFMRSVRGLIDNLPGVPERYTYTLDNGSADGLPGRLIMEEQDVDHTDAIAAIAHKNHGLVREFFKQVLGRDSFDNKGGDIHGTVHTEQNLDNAFWTGSQMAYGDGLIFDSLAKSLNVAAHELGHGVIQHTSNFQYWFESGALNESYADVIGVCCEQWADGDKINEAKWLIGWDIVTAKFPGKALRSFKNEKAYTGDSQPKNKKKQYWGLEDNGGVHINSGIPNHCFYLFCLKYAEIEPDKPYAWFAPLDVWMKALPLMHSWSSFGDLKKSTIKVCKQSYPKLVHALESSWKEVGM